MSEFVVGPSDATPPGRYINGEGYAHYQVQSNGTRKTVQEHQLVALLDGADPYKVFSNGEYHVSHGHAWPERPPDDGSLLAELLKQFNFSANLELKESTEHARLTNTARQ